MKRKWVNMRFPSILVAEPLDDAWLTKGLLLLPKYARMVARASWLVRSQLQSLFMKEISRRGSLWKGVLKTVSYRGLPLYSCRRVKFYFVHSPSKLLNYASNFLGGAASTKKTKNFNLAQYRIAFFVDWRKWNPPSSTVSTESSTVDMPN